MIARPSTESRRAFSVPAWRMPITLESYPLSDPRVTDEEATLLDFYATETNEVVGGLAGATLAKLERFDRPFRDALRLHTKYDRVTARSRRHLFRYMAQTRAAFCSWSPETWSEVIQTTTGGSHRNEGMRFGMLTLAYLFSGFLYTGKGRHISRWQMPFLARTGYAKKPTNCMRHWLRWATARMGGRKSAFAASVPWPC